MLVTQRMLKEKGLPISIPVKTGNSSEDWDYIEIPLDTFLEGMKKLDIKCVDADMGWKTTVWLVPMTQPTI